MRKIFLIVLVLALAACNNVAHKRDTYDQINAEMKKGIDANLKPANPDAVAASLLPPLTIDMPQSRKTMEERFNLTFSQAPAQQFFMSIASGTRYNMMVHPDVNGAISATLKNVTLFEALDAVRELYGYEYKVEGNRIYIKPLTLQTAIFRVNYLNYNRKGASDIRVMSGSVGDSSSQSGTSSATTGSGTSSTTRSLESSKISTTSTSNFWPELKTSLEAIVGSKEGRSVVINPRSGVVVVRAMSDELRNVSAFLKATQLSVDRQVILEAKIMEVELNDGFQSGINWSGFRSGGHRASGGFLTPSGTLSTTGSMTSGTGVTGTAGSSLNYNSTATLASNYGSALQGGLFGLAFQSNHFAAMISFLESQGTVHVLSSPRIATMNNEKAVLKVGTDEYFVTEVTTNSGTTSGGTTTQPTASVKVQSFFSGVSLDVTPQIDEDGNIVLHVHPSVSNVSTVNKTIDLGTQIGTFNLPLAASAVSETDSVVRGKSGDMIAIGGLMRQSSVSDRSQLPGAGDVPVVGNLFRNTVRSTQKRELVILIKPTIVEGGSNWAKDMMESSGRIKAMEPPAAQSTK
ncbi:MAG: pilus (MSHA type) biogenesis protein MshL [Oxalobacter sp.]|nr:MAG: pilus (MSHA type) biogenesis protein MshL [Oxalobacter sp.]